MKIIIDLCEEDFVENKNLVSNIYILVNGQPFPDAGWSDFVIIIIDWWNREYLKNFSNESILSCDFMDGPYSYEIRLTAEGFAYVECIDSSPHTSHVLNRANINLDDFKQELLKASLYVINECKKQNYNSNDLKNLSISYKKLTVL